ncbi:MAG: hypothetical protein ACJAWT_002006 [Glaciecola sp.]|jgi:hypothetical protein
MTLVKILFVAVEDTQFCHVIFCFVGCYYLCGIGTHSGKNYEHRFLRASVFLNFIVAPSPQ